MQKPTECACISHWAFSSPMDSFVTGESLNRQGSSVDTSHLLALRGRHFPFLDAQNLGRLACVSTGALSSLMPSPRTCRFAEVAWRQCFLAKFFPLLPRRGSDPDDLADDDGDDRRRARNKRSRLNHDGDDGHDEGVSCAICLEQVIDGRVIDRGGRGQGDALRLPCGHLYHRRCAVRSFYASESSSSCINLEPATLMYIFILSSHHAPSFFLF